MKVKPAEKRKANKQLKEAKEKLASIEVQLKGRPEGVVKEHLIGQASQLRADIQRLSHMFQHGAQPNER